MAQVMTGPRLEQTTRGLRSGQVMRRTRSAPRMHATPAAPDRAASWGVALVEALIGYTWLLSALDKILDPGFRAGLAAQLMMAMRGNPNTWWVALANRLILPHAQLCAVLVEGGELLVALGFFTGAALWASGQFPARRWARRLNLGVLGALVGGAGMTANYYVMSGATLPGLNPADAFNEGLSIDGLLTLVAVGLCVIHLLPLVARRRLSTDGVGTVGRAMVRA